MPDKDELTLEKLQIHDRLVAVEYGFRGMSDKLEEFMKESRSFRDEMSECMKDVRHTINGSSANIGLLEKVRSFDSIKKDVVEHNGRLDSLEKEKAKLFGGAAVVAFLSGILAKMWWK